ncbi:ATP-binding cassette subfamily B multidrug efflux pump [Bacilli bacterium PM5-3]|nr:ATP-binding cassette subfamily B multidrug efflux pump [Bacilli bacterium PM5-3]
MKIVFKYLKGFTVSLLIAIVLLFVQAFSELNLPNYMSDIVNVGLQQNGIEHSAPDAISQDGMKFVKTFLNEQEQTLLDENYQLIDLNDDYKKKYPDAKDDIYILDTSLKSSEKKELDRVFGVSSWTFINVAKELSKDSPSKNDEKSGINNINTSDLYKNQAMFEMVPKKVMTKAHEDANKLDDTMLKQSGIVFSKAFYTELGIDLDQNQTSYIFKVGILMLGVALIGGVATIIVNLFSSRIATGVARKMRSDLFEKIESFSNVEYDKISTSSLITRATNDVMQIQTLLTMGIRIVCYSPILAIGGIVMALEKAPSASWTIALAVIITLGLMFIVVAIAMPKFKIVQKLVDRVNLISREQLSGLTVVRAFYTEKYEEERFDKANIDLSKTNLFVNRLMSIMQPMMTFIMNGLSVLIIWVGAHEIAASNMQVGDMMAFMQYAIQVLMSFVMISIMFIMIPRAAVSAERIKEVLDLDIVITDPKQSKQFDESKKGIVEFKDVSFRYGDAQEDAITNINFVAKPNKVTAIIGSTGSGKTTIANLLMRFFDVTSGSILVDGVDVREVSQEALHSKIGYVPQKGVLLSGTIESNLKYGNKEASDEEMKRVAKIAQASDFINAKSDKFESEISQGGKNVSGGQKQRLSIARALAINPEILFFDDSFSALDFKTDATLRQSINDNVKDVTMIIVAQRISTIMNADNILVIDKGRIVGQGTHKELLKNCSEYFEIASSQLSKEELSYE